MTVLFGLSHFWLFWLSLANTPNTDAHVFSLLTDNHLQDWVFLCTLSRRQDQVPRQDDSATETGGLGALQQRLSHGGGGGGGNWDVTEVQTEAICRGSVTNLPGTFRGGAGDACVSAARVGGLSLGPLCSRARLSAGVRD